jgi:adenylosuccinate lyase
MSSNSLKAVSPVDGRYSSQSADLAEFFSEFGLIKYRVRVEIEYFIALCELPLEQLKDFNKKLYPALREIYLNFSDENALEIKDIEKTTNHDVKAVEYFIKARFEELNIQEFSEFIHFGLTSQDINNTAIPLSMKEAHENVIGQSYTTVLNKLKDFSTEWAEVSMLAKTHGQPASPTRLGKEIKVFAERVEKQLGMLDQVLYAAKLAELPEISTLIM